MLNVVEYLKNKGKSRRIAKDEVLAIDLVNGLNVECSGLGIVYGDFTWHLFQPKSKKQGEIINEILLEVKRIVLTAIMANEKVLIVLQLGYFWWWKWKEERRLKELVVVPWKTFNEEQKKRWKRWNKELNIIAENLIEWLNSNKYNWIYVVDRKIKEFWSKTSIRVSEELNRNIKDGVGLILMYWEGQLKGFEEVKRRIGTDYYWNNYETINGIKRVKK